jgi:hypothetical protein
MFTSKRSGESGSCLRGKWPHYSRHALDSVLKEFRRSDLITVLPSKWSVARLTRHLQRPQFEKIILIEVEGTRCWVKVRHHGELHGAAGIEPMCQQPWAVFVYFERLFNETLASNKVPNVEGITKSPKANIYPTWAQGIRDQTKYLSLFVLLLSGAAFFWALVVPNEDSLMRALP